MKRVYKPNGQVLRDWLEKNHYSYKEFGKISNLSVCAINRFCNENGNTSDKTLHKIFETTGLEYDSLIKSDIDINLDINL